MAISVDQKEDSNKKPFKPDKLFWILIELVVVLLLAFGGLKIYNTSIQGKILSAEEDIKKLDSQRDLALEKEIQADIAKFKKIEPLLNSHIRAKNIFDILERDTYTAAQISNLDFNAKEKTLTLSVTSPSATALALQTSIFKSDSDISKVEVGGFSFSPEGMRFQLKITLNPNVIKY